MIKNETANAIRLAVSLFIINFMAMNYKFYLKAYFKSLYNLRLFFTKEKQ